MWTRIIFLFLIVILSESMGYGELSMKPNGVNVLRISPDPRGEAMGGVGVGFCGVNAAGLYWNPASLSGIEKKELCLMHNEWITDLQYEFIGVCLPIKDNYLGLSTAYLHMDRIDGRDEDRNKISYESYDLVNSIFYARAFQYYGCGVSLKAISSKISDEYASAMGMDIGMVYNMDERIGYGISLNNIGLKPYRFIEVSDSLPLNLRFGGYYKNEQGLLSCIEWVKEREKDITVACGLEYEIFKGYKDNNLYLRAGYNSGREKRIGCGIGIKHSRFSVDYSYKSGNSWLGDTHHVSMNLECGK